MTHDLLFQASFLVGTWVVTGWVTLMVTKVKLEAWMDRTRRLEQWKDKSDERQNNHEVRISILENKS